MMRESSSHFQNAAVVHPGCNLTSNDIKECRRELKDILIAPFDESKCKGVGYNLSPSELCYSVNRRCLLQVYRTAQEVYVMIPPHDTVLTLSHEYLQVGPQIAGCFLSRLRPVTKGLGNISTTLDPCWKGMLLLPINNPSSRKIKLVIRQIAQDKLVPVGLTTMIIWQISHTKENTNGTLTFRLDNPAMRTDIWAELTEESLGSKKYQHFKKIIEQLTNFTPSTEEPAWISQLQEQLDRLECAIRASQWRGDTIREVLLYICHLECDKMPQELLNKLYKLYYFDGGPQSSLAQCQHRIEETLDRLARQDGLEPYSKDIYLAYQECNYQRLCFQVEEIHKMIKKESNYIWRWNGLKRFLYRFLRPHLSGIVASVVLAVFLFFGGQADEESYITRIVISIVPALLSFLLDKKR